MIYPEVLDHSDHFPSFPPRLGFQFCLLERSKPEHFQGRLVEYNLFLPVFIFFKIEETAFFQF